MPNPDFCDLRFYDSVADLASWRTEIGEADLVMVGSYVVDGAQVIEAVRPWARRLAFYDIDTPITLAKLARNEAEYISSATIPLLDVYFSFTGGPTLEVLQQKYGARDARALYCAVDEGLYRPASNEPRWDLGYLGTYSDDRQPVLERLLLEPARQSPNLRFVVAGPLYPASIVWPANVERIEHLPPAQHATFYNDLAWTLNVTRADMVTAGYSPSVRLFEAAACATPIISDWWLGLDSFFRPGGQIAIAATTQDVLDCLAWPLERRRALGEAARTRVLHSHTAKHRAQTLEDAMLPGCVPA